jgi:hypothetical protein
VAVAVTMTKVMGELSTDLSAFKVTAEQNKVRIEKDAKRSRRLINLLGVSLVFDILLSFGLGYVAIRANTASNKAAAATSAARVNANNAVSACQSANTNAATNLQVLNYILNRPTPDPQTPTQIAAAGELKDYVAKAFAQHVCTVTVTP